VERMRLGLDVGRQRRPRDARPEQEVVKQVTGEVEESAASLEESGVDDRQVVADDPRNRGAGAVNVSGGGQLDSAVERLERRLRQLRRVVVVVELRRGEGFLQIADLD